MYRAAARERGFTLSGRFLAGARLSFELQERFGREYLAELGCSFGQAWSNWPAMMTREGTRTTYSPVKHVLLNAFFQLPAERRGAFVYRTPGKRLTDVTELDPRLARMVKKEAVRLLKTGRTGTVESVLRATGHWELFRHNRDQFPQTNAEVLAFRKTDASERKSGGRAVHAGRLRAIAEGRQKPFRTWSQRPKRERSGSEE
ncbi:TnsD family Tn7-like transposition protein [Rubrivivax sp. RP6-9]|uniref:TnsD family Tn7-like transposition protein n=1 Tax=Rubrivivax sp. RP6-9 TaxID=3415750 RepID=UPI003CC59305